MVGVSRRWSIAVLTIVGAVALVLPMLVLSRPGIAQAAPVSRIVKVASDGPQGQVLSVYSASMQRTIPVEVLLPHNAAAPAPVFYLLNGAGGGEDGATWDKRTDYRKYFADKQTYVVTPVGGEASYYTNWLHVDANLGINQWQTFLTEELPPLINAHYRTTGRNAIGGISMSGTSVFNLAIAAPRLYTSVAAWSGCARTSDPIGQQYVRLVVTTQPGAANFDNMWGPPGGPLWIENDPYINAAKLRGTKIYMSSGTGLPGPHETLNDPSVNGDVPWLANQTVVGGIIEAAIDQCTRQMATRLQELHIPADVTLRPTGTHSWGYWQDDLKQTWPKIARDLAG